MQQTMSVRARAPSPTPISSPNPPSPASPPDPACAGSSAAHTAPRRCGRPLRMGVAGWCAPAGRRNAYGAGAPAPYAFDPKRSDRVHQTAWGSHANSVWFERMWLGVERIRPYRPYGRRCSTTGVERMWCPAGPPVPARGCALPARQLEPWDPSSFTCEARIPRTRMIRSHSPADGSGPVSLHDSLRLLLRGAGGTAMQRS
jgi:hypothetical protein